MLDTRVKGCPNEECYAYKRIRYKTSDQYCSKCGTELVLVCAKCWTPLAEDNVKKRICDKCEAIRNDSLKKVKDALKKVGTGIVAVVPVVVAAAEKAPDVLKDITKSFKK